MAPETNQLATTAPKPNLLSAVSKWPRNRQLSLVAVVLLCLVFFAVIIVQTRSADYSLLYANLSSTDASAVLERLKEQKIPYRLEDGGKAIHIPVDKVYEMRLELAGIGLPQGGGVGFEIFDKQSFGMTDFAQKVNYRRALQGELARTIASLAPVESARVHLALPEKRVFKEQQQPATASVILKLTPGRELNEGQVQGVVNLVVGSVEGLESKHVSVIDSSGRLLSKTPLDSDAGPLAASKLDYQLTVEKRLERRAQALLDRALGAGNSLVQVTAELDFSQRERLEETYDPNATAVRSEQISEEKGGREMVGGVPGAASNTGGARGDAGIIASSRTDETTNYEVSKVVSKLVAPVGDVKNISVSVLVADRLVAAADGQEATREPRPEEELKAIETMVRSALGINESRGDQLTVVSRPFENDLFADDFVESSPVSRLYEYMPLIKLLLAAAGAALLYLLLLRPLLKTLKGEGKMTEHYKTVQELESELIGQDQQVKIGPGSLDESVLALRQEIMQSRTGPAQVIKTWLKEEAKG